MNSLPLCLSYAFGKVTQSWHHLSGRGCNGSNDMDSHGVFLYTEDIRTYPVFMRACGIIVFGNAAIRLGGQGPPCLMFGTSQKVARRQRI